VKETQRTFLPHLKAPQPYASEDFVTIDPQTQRNLELLDNMFEGGSRGHWCSPCSTQRSHAWAVGV
jgi:DNA mismatch repair protein MutS